jgi:hypothetical protein
VAYRPREVAEMVGMSESGIRNLIRRGRFAQCGWTDVGSSQPPRSRTSSASSSTRASPSTRRRRAGGRASPSVVRPEVGDAQSSYWGVLFMKTILPSRVML